MARWGALTFLVGVLAGSAAWGAPVVQVKSEQILVNCGSGYRAVANFTEVQPGCMVMASTEGHGYVGYSDCDVEILPGKVHTVKQDPGPEAEKAFRPICKVAGVPWWLVGAAIPIAICAADDCFDGNNKPTSP